MMRITGAKVALKILHRSTAIANQSVENILTSKIQSRVLPNFCRIELNINSTEIILKYPFYLKF